MPSAASILSNSLPAVLRTASLTDPLHVRVPPRQKHTRASGEPVPGTAFVRLRARSHFVHDWTSRAIVVSSSDLESNAGRSEAIGTPFRNRQLIDDDETYPGELHEHQLRYPISRRHNKWLASEVSKNDVHLAPVVAVYGPREN